MATSIGLPEIGKVAAGAASAGTGGTFSYLLFKDMNVPELLQQGTIYALTVFATVAVIVIFAGYAALPSKENDFLRRATGYILSFMVALAVLGFLFQMVQEYRNPKIPINATFMPDLQRVNKEYATAYPDLQLTADLDDGSGKPILLQYDKNSPVLVQKGTHIILKMDTLPDLLRANALNSAHNGFCSTGACNNLKPQGGDDVSKHE